MTINGVSFKSTKAAKAHIKGILRDLGTCEIFETHPSFLFFKDLLLTSHDGASHKIKDGIIGFKFTRDARNGSDPYIIHPDRSTTGFSVNHCFNKYNPILNLQSACRTSEYDKRNLEQYRANVCAKCGFPGRTEIDHMVPFRKVFKEFMVQVSSKPPRSFNERRNGSIAVREFKPSAYVFEQEWIDFLVSNYPNNYQALCPPCNKSKGAKEEESEEETEQDSEEDVEQVHARKTKREREEDSPQGIKKAKQGGRLL